MKSMNNELYFGSFRWTDVEAFKRKKQSKRLLERTVTFKHPLEVIPSQLVIRRF